MSNQVYRNSTPQSPNVYVSDLIKGDGSGGSTIPVALTIAVPPPVVSGDYSLLARDRATGGLRLTATPNVPPTGFTGLQLTVNQTVPSSVITLVQYDNPFASDPFVTQDGHGLIGIEADGLYTFTHTTAWIASAGNIRWAWIEVESTSPTRFASTNLVAPGGFNSVQTGSVVLSLVDGDLVRVFAFQTTGGNLDLSGGSFEVAADVCTLTIQRLSI